jgi:hypothetical protein
MKKPKLIRLFSQSGDWEGLFVDGNLVDEGHTLGEGTAPQFWMDIAHRYGVKGSDLTDKEVTYEDNAYLYRCGRFPKTLGELNGTYL